MNHAIKEWIWGLGSATTNSVVLNEELDQEWTCFTDV